MTDSTVRDLLAKVRQEITKTLGVAGHSVYIAVDVPLQDFNRLAGENAYQLNLDSDEISAGDGDSMIVVKVIVDDGE